MAFGGGSLPPHCTYRRGGGSAERYRRGGTLFGGGSLPPHFNTGRGGRVSGEIPEGRNAFLVAETRCRPAVIPEGGEGSEERYRKGIWGGVEEER